jgi:membrane protease YdiL (CAAX protease family)
MADVLNEALPMPELPVPKAWPQWGWMDVAAVVAIFIGAMLIVSVMGIGLLPLTPFFRGTSTTEMVKQPLFFVPAQLLSYVLAFIFIRMFITVRAEEDFWHAVQWNAPDFGGVSAGIVAGIALALVILIIQTIIPMPKALPIEQYFKDPLSATLLGLFAVLVAPFAEEIFFRGLLLPVAVRSVGKVAAVIFVSLAFALIHASQLGKAVGPVAVLFIVGVALTMRRLSKRSLAASWLMHASYNATLFGIMLWVTRGFQHLDKLK